MPAGCSPWTQDTEITLEANPTSIEAGRFAAYRAAGVNRVSIGVQSFDPAALRFLGRQHSGRAGHRRHRARRGRFFRACPST